MAIKRIYNAFANKVDAKRTYREIMYLLHLSDHPNIVKLHDVIPSKNDLDVYLVMEEVDADLSQVISSMFTLSRLMDIVPRWLTAHPHPVHYVAIASRFEVYTFSEDCASRFETSEYFD